MAQQPMTPGGQWMIGGTGTPHYVLDPDHVKRLLAEGFQIIDDPRSEDEVNAEGDDDEESEEEETEDDDEEEEEPEIKPKKRAKK